MYTHDYTKITNNIAEICCIYIQFIMDRSNRKDTVFFIHTSYCDVAVNAKRFKFDTSKFTKSLNNVILKIYDLETIFDHLIGFFFIVFYATFNNISVISCTAVSFIGGGKRSTQRKPPTCHESLTNFIT